MATNYLDTGDTGRAVSAESDGALFAGIFGAEKYVLENGSQLKAEVQSNNIVKISDGDAVMYGRHVRIPANDSALVTINNGHSGTNRIDLIVFRYTKDSTGKETVDLVVIQGEDSTGTATAPTAVDGNILTGAMQSDFPLYSVELNGINIVKVNPLFNVIGNISKLKEELTELNSKLTNTNTKLYETYVDPSTKSICIRFPINRIQICAGTILVYASLQQNGTGYAGVSTKIEQSTFPKPFKILRGCTITQNSDDWVMILGKITTLNGISQLRLGYFTAYTNKAFYMDYIAIGTY